MTPEQKAVIKAAEEWEAKTWSRAGGTHPEDMKLSAAVRDLKDREKRGASRDA